MESQLHGKEHELIFYDWQGEGMECHSWEEQEESLNMFKDSSQPEKSEN